MRISVPGIVDKHVSQSVPQEVRLDISVLCKHNLHHAHQSTTLQTEERTHRCGTKTAKRRFVVASINVTTHT
jgi:hypothetical protein